MRQKSFLKKKEKRGLQGTGGSGREGRVREWWLWS